MPVEPEVLDVLVVGAGPAGIGTALALSDVEDLSFAVLERGEVGQTFLNWAPEQTFLTPSFTGNGFGATDLNAIHPLTSPAFSLGADYLTGAQYERYLRGVVKYFEVPVFEGVEVMSVQPGGDTFQVRTSQGDYAPRAVVWAGGEFHDPRMPRMAGSELSVHSSSPQAWEAQAGDVVVIGGYESGIELACHHVELDANVVVVDSVAPWEVTGTSDPSFRLAPRTRMRLDRALATGKLTLRGDHAQAIATDTSSYTVTLADGTVLRSHSPPIAATGFGPGLGPVAHLFARAEDGWPELDDDDQSVVTPGLFLSGPAVRHGTLVFCFIYKFRQRFAHIAEVIADDLGKKADALEEWRLAGMLTDDLSCCGVECEC